MMIDKPILEVRNLSVSVRTDNGVARILDHVDFSISKGEVLGVVGESGCGKSTLLRCILGLPPKGASIDTGQIMFRSQNLLTMPPKEVARKIRGRAIGFIPQDPFQSFNPLFTVGKQMLEILRWSGLKDQSPDARYDREMRRRHKERFIEILRAVQIPDPEAALSRYPHEFSGGQRQRILIAGALASQPDLVLADEPTTALDVTTQMQILKLLQSLAKQFDVGMLFITHDFGVVAQICDRVSVMYSGQTVETSTASGIIDNPAHPYTEMLMRCHPERSSEIVGIPGQVSSPLDPPPGCRFNPRCPVAQDVCSQSRPHLRGKFGGHRLACHVRGVPA